MHDQRKRKHSCRSGIQNTCREIYDRAAKTIVELQSGVKVIKNETDDASSRGGSLLECRTLEIASTRFRKPQGHDDDRTQKNHETAAETYGE